MSRTDSLPYIPFHPRADFIGDPAVAIMSLAERGAYMTLLCFAWADYQAATLPDDDKALAKMCRTSKARFAKLKAAALHGYALEHGRWRNAKLRALFDRILSKQEQLRRAGIVGAEKKWGKRIVQETPLSGAPTSANAECCDGQALARPSECHSDRSATAMANRWHIKGKGIEENTIPPYPPLPAGRARRAPKPMPAIPALLDVPPFRAAWDAWMAHRAEIRKPLTPESVKRQYAQCMAMGASVAVAAIENSIAAGYQGIFAARPSPANGHAVRVVRSALRSQPD